jgi:hypothetical protein
MQYEPWEMLHELNNLLHGLFQKLPDNFACPLEAHREGKSMESVKAFSGKAFKFEVNSK